MIEILVTLSIAAIFVAIAVPSYRSIINRNSVAAQVNDFLADLNYMRSEAISRGVPVRICKSNNTQGCTTSGGWQQGWVIFDNADNNDTPAANEIIRARNALQGGTQIAGNRNVANAIEFDANGFAINSNGTLAFCDAENGNATNVVISTSGRTRSEETGDCTP